MDGNDYSLATRIKNLFTGKTCGHTASEIQSLLAAPDSQLDSIKQDTLTRTLNRMADKKILVKIGRGTGALYCLPEAAETVRAACQLPPAPSQVAQAIQSTKRFRFPKLEDIAMNLDEEVTEKALPLFWPLEIERLANVYPGNVIVLGGVTNAGKTAFLLDFVRRNMDRYNIRVLNSEMKLTELKQRLRGFEQHCAVPFDSWKRRVKFVSWKGRVGDDHSVAGLLHYLDPHGINVIDYVTASEDFPKIAAVLDRIDEKLKEGIAIVALQKDEKAKLPYGRLFTSFVTRLGMVLDPSSCDNEPCVRLSFFKAKFPANENLKPEQVKIWFTIEGGAKITRKKADPRHQSNA